MTLTLDFDLDILEMYLCTESKVCKYRLSKVRAATAQTDEQTDATKGITTLHSWVVNI